MENPNVFAQIELDLTSELASFLSDNIQSVRNALSDLDGVRKLETPESMDLPSLLRVFMEWFKKSDCIPHPMTVHEGWETYTLLHMIKHVRNRCYHRSPSDPPTNEQTLTDLMNIVSLLRKLRRPQGYPQSLQQLITDVQSEIQRTMRLYAEASDQNVQGEDHGPLREEIGEVLDQRFTAMQQWLESYTDRRFTESEQTVAEAIEKSPSSNSRRALYPIVTNITALRHELGQVSQRLDELNERPAGIERQIQSLSFILSSVLRELRKLRSQTHYDTAPVVIPEVAEPEPTYDYQTSAGPLTEQEARDMLISLRERMMAENPGVPREQGLLRKNVLQQILYHRITNERELRRRLSYEMRSVPTSLLGYLSNVFKIVSRIQPDAGPKGT